MNTTTTYHFSQKQFLFAHKNQKCRKIQFQKAVQMALKTNLTDEVKTNVQDVKNASLELEDLLKIEYIKPSYNEQQLLQMIMIAGCAGFGSISYDVFNESSLHLLAPVDASVHNWVNLNCSEQMRSFSDAVISNVPIAIGTVGCAYSAARMLLKVDRLEIQKLALMLPFFVLGFGYFDGQFKAGGVAANTLKAIFQRARPSQYLHSFAYPSGHSSTCTFMLGMFLIVFIPLISSQDNNNYQRSDKILSFLNKNKYYLWLMGWAVTGSGRLLADVHWFSDVCAGLSLGLALVAAGKLSLLQLEQIQENQEQGELSAEIKTSDLDSMKI
eukprot:TRINITY_DN24656_c0_g1_i1.p1 TRINITY_DN24656_c0_g1~~TRINITY_DN24656_c0_g1_i1.p1  ORF type:complete len:327 (-),score=36.70 TRINITY_DN24656_c0_g1_i1:999-1979(-)